MPSDVPILECRKGLAVLLEDVVQQTLNNTTHLYLSVEEGNGQYPSIYYRYIFTGLRYPRQIETVAYNTFFPKDKSSRGNTCSQLFMGTVSDRWSVYPLGN